MRSIIFAACIGATFAIKQVADEQVEAAIVDAPVVVADHDSESFRKFHTKIAAESHLDADIDGVNAKIDAWFANTARPAVHEFADLVEVAAWHDQEAEHGHLLDTCAEGTACRDEVENRITKVVDEKWDKLMDGFKTDVQTTISQTEVLVNDGWEEFEQCEHDHPCCEIQEVTWANLQKNIERIKKLINDKYVEYDTHQEEIDRIEEECEDVDFTAYRAGWTAMDRPNLDELAN
jgi:hypothetical protein